MKNNANRTIIITNKNVQNQDEKNNCKFIIKHA